MIKRNLVTAGLLGAIAAPGMALAQDADTLPISANLTFTTDYVFRGISQTDEKFAVQGGFDYAHEETGLYVGTWGSNVAGGTASAELDVYGGWAKSYGDFGVDVGYIHYNYPGNSSLNTDEIYLGGSWKWFEAKYSYTISDEYFGVLDATGTQYFMVGASYELPMGFTIGGHYGTTMLDGSTAGIPNDQGDYDDYMLSVGYTYKGFDLALAYTDNDIDNPSNIEKDRVFFSVSKSF
jgi:uncharacterized protein (TIGR02001 family)